MRTTRTARLVLAALTVLATAGVVSAQTGEENATQIRIGGLNLEGYTEAGVRFFGERPSEKQEAKFLEYRDINQGLYLDDLHLRLFTPDEKYSFEVSGRDWGLETQEFHLGAEQLGRWEAGFDWDQMRHIFSTDSRTIEHEAARGVFILDNPAPPVSLRDFDGRFHDLGEVSVRWDTAHMFFRLMPTPESDVMAEYTRIRKDGDRPMGMAFGSPGSNFLELLQPIEQTIHDFRLKASWATPRWQLQFSYVLSIFENDLDQVQFDNPCFGNPLCSAGDRTGPKFGTTSLPPDNIAHTLSLQGGVNLPLRTRINANLSYSWRFQNADFLPQTQTNTLPLTHPELGLPEKSLHGDVQILLFNLTATSRPFPIPVTFTAKYRLYDMMDNSTHPSFSAFIIDDVSSISQGPQEADRFDFKKQNADFDARWQIIQPVALTLGAAWERWDRSADFEVPHSDEFFAKAALDYTPTDWLMIRGTYKPSFRRIDRYCVDCLPQGEENAEPGELGQSFLLRKYNEADRNRHRADLMVQITPNDRLTITPVASYTYDDYIASGLTHDATAVAPAGCPVGACSFNGTNMLGLQQVTSWSAGMDVNWNPLDWISFSAGYVREYNFQKMRSRNRTSTVDVPDLDWVSNNIDTTDTYHASLIAKIIPGTLDLKLSGNYEYALGRIETYNPNAPGSAIYNANNSTNAVARPFPAFEDSLLRLDAALRYHFLKNWTASLYYAFETFRKHDWRTDALNPFFLNQSCTAAGCPVDAVWLGNDPRNYEAHIVGLTLAYRFR